MAWLFRERTEALEPLKELWEHDTSFCQLKNLAAISMSETAYEYLLEQRKLNI